MFERLVQLNAIKIQFQGGFSSKEIELVLINSESKEERREEFNLEDTNREQEIRLKESVDCDQVKINLNNPSDDFGRVIIYKLNLLSN